MSVVVVTGSGGLIGSETVRFFHNKGYMVVGIDNNLRQYFFGQDGSVQWNISQLKTEFKQYSHLDLDIRDQDGLFKVFSRLKNEISLVVHTAAQPSHDWAAKEPFTDFTVNANGTLNLLEATRLHCPDAPFIFTSTNKVYGDTPNFLPLIEKENRWELSEDHPYFKNGIDEQMSIDQSKHSIFGASKVAADVLTQEYGRYFGMKTAVFRGGCLTGPAHSGAELHGFLAYLVKCAILGKPYTVFGYKGKQVRDNIHANDLVSAFWNFFQNPRSGEVYNMGGARHSNCSMLEAIQMVAEISGKHLDFSVQDQARSGDHIWWISDVSKFQNHYPNWKFQYGIRDILKEIIDAVQDRETAEGRSHHAVSHHPSA